MTYLNLLLTSPDATNPFLTRKLLPLLQQIIYTKKGARAFFFRKDNTRQTTIELIVKAEASWLEATVEPSLSQFMTPPDTFQISYPPARLHEPWMEEFFHLTTRVTLSRLSGHVTYGDSLFDALRLHTITAWAAGLDPMQVSCLFEDLTDDWFDSQKNSDPHFKKNTLRGFSEQLNPQKTEIQEPILELWKTLYQNNFDKNQPDWLRWIRGNQLIVPELGKQQLPALFECINHQLGINPYDGLYLQYIHTHINR
jgi:hypothetical protein